MSALPDLAAMHLLLRQGRGPAWLSLALLLAALVLLGLLPNAGLLSMALLLASVLAGLVQGVYAWRVQLDADLLRLLLDEGLHGEPAAQRVDQLLAATGLRRRAQGALRGWNLRWAGMRGLLRGQYLMTGVQTLLLLLAVLWPQP